MGEEEGLEKYNDHLSREISPIIEELRAVQEACNFVVNAFEKKHCAYFQKELEEAKLLQSNANTPSSRPTQNSGNTCDKLSHRIEVKEGNVCIIESEMHRLVGGTKDESNNYVATYTCPPDSLMYFIEDKTNINGILKALDDVAGEHCKKIKRLYLAGHGEPGFLANGLNRENVHQLKDYSCLMADNSTVDLSGCSAGKGCAGKLFMQKAAEALFQNTQGTIISPNVNTLFGQDVGVWSNRSFAYNSLTFTPPPPEPSQTKWEKLENQVSYHGARTERDSYQNTIMEGLLGTPIEDKSLPDECIDEIEEKQNAIRREIVPALRRGCKPLGNCNPFPFANLLDQAGLWMRAKESSNNRGYNRSSTFEQAAKVANQLDTVLEKLKDCGKYCLGSTRIKDVCPRENRESCINFDNRGPNGSRRCTQFYMRGCDLNDYFLPNIRNTTTIRSRSRSSRGTR